MEVDFDNLHTYNKKELEKFCEKFNISCEGNKSELVLKLKDYEKQNVKNELLERIKSLEEIINGIKLNQQASENVSGIVQNVELSSSENLEKHDHVQTCPISNISMASLPSTNYNFLPSYPYTQNIQQRTPAITTSSPPLNFNERYNSASNEIYYNHCNTNSLYTHNSQSVNRHLMYGMNVNPSTYNLNLGQTSTSAYSTTVFTIHTHRILQPHI